MYDNNLPPTVSSFTGGKIIINPGFNTQRVDDNIDLFTSEDEKGEIFNIFNFCYCILL